MMAAQPYSPRASAQTQLNNQAAQLHRLISGGSSELGIIHEGSSYTDFTTDVPHSVQYVCPESTGSLHLGQFGYEVMMP